MFFSLLFSIICFVTSNPVLPVNTQIYDTQYNYAVDMEFWPITADQFKCLYKQGYKTVFVQAHSGLHGPEFDNNSIISYQNAVASGVPINLVVTLQVMPDWSTGTKQLDDTYYTLKNAGIIIKSFVLVCDDYASLGWLNDPLFGVNDRANFINDVKKEAARLNLNMGILTNKHDWPQIVGDNLMIGSGTFLWYRSVHSGGLTGETPANFDDFTPFGAWSKPTLKMFGVEEAVCGVNMLNRLITLLRGRGFARQRLPKCQWNTEKTPPLVPPTRITEDSNCPVEKVAIHKRHRLLFSNDAFPFGIRDEKDARRISQRLLAGERKMLFDALRKMADQYLEHKRLGNAEIHIDDLLRTWYINFVPSCVLGLVDSIILLFAAELIEDYLAAVYAITLLGAAAAGNVISNALQNPTQMTMVIIMDRLGISRPVLSTEQLHTPEFRVISNGGKFLGILFGSIIGMFPLYFIDEDVANGKSLNKKKSEIPSFSNPFVDKHSFAYADNKDD